MALYKLLTGSHSRMEGEATKVYKRSTDPHNPTIIDLSPREVESLKGRIEPVYREVEKEVATAEDHRKEIAINKTEVTPPKETPKVEFKTEEETESDKVVGEGEGGEVEGEEEEDEDEKEDEEAEVEISIPDVTLLPLAKVRSLLKTVDSLDTVAAMYDMEEKSKKPRVQVLKVIKDRYVALGGEVEE